MVSPKQLLSVVESTLLGPSAPSPSQKIELLHAIRSFSPSLRSFLSFPPPKPSDRSQVMSKEVKLPDYTRISLDDEDVQIALKLSDDLHLNEIYCVQLIVSANQEWGLSGRKPLEIVHLAAGIWYTERRDLITALYTLLRAIVLDQGLEVNLVADIHKYLEELIHAGLKQRFVSLIRELNRDEPAGLGGPHSEHVILDSHGTLVERRAVVCRERLILSHCLVLSVLVVRTSHKEIKDIFSALKESATESNFGINETLKHQITYSLLFSLVIVFISDALSVLPDKSSIMSSDSSFRLEFHEVVIATGDDSSVEGFVNCVRLAWSVHLMLIQNARKTVSSAPVNGLSNIYLCLDTVLSNNVFQFLVDRVLRSVAYQNDDEDMVYMYNAYLHKLITIFISHPIAKDKIKGIKEKAMTLLNPYRIAGSRDIVRRDYMDPHQATEIGSQPFVSLMDFLSELYEKEPQLLFGNDVLWMFVNFAGEGHITNVETLVAFLKMLGTLASSEEGAKKVFELLQNKTFHSVRWSILFDSLSIYEERFKQSLQNNGAMLPDIQEGDAKALVAYLNVLQKVVENGNHIERKNWFPDIEPLFKLLSYESVPSYLKGGLRNVIATFVKVSHTLKDTIWSYVEQYDLPVVVGPLVQDSVQQISTRVYDMQFELNEIEARRELYPSTISFINLLNTLIAEERDVRDGGRRFIGIFRFIYDHVFGSFFQRAYADLNEKWMLAVACLQHFHMILCMYNIDDEDIDNVVDRTEHLALSQPTSLPMPLPVIELLKDFMSGKTVLRIIMGILTVGVNSVITERSHQIYGQHLEKAVQLSLEIIVIVLEKDMILSDSWRPLYQPLDVVLSQDRNHIVALLEYVRYDFCPQIQRCSIKIMSILSSRMAGLVQLLLKSNSANSLIEDYAACLDLRSEESQIIENITDDLGVLILQLLIDNINRPSPNVTHLMLMFDVDARIEETILQPKVHYSCLKVILDLLGKLSKPDVNALLHEFGLQLLYELCLDPLTSGPVMILLCNKKYLFFLKHLDTIGIAPLPKRNVNQALRISSLHQRAWLLKILAMELHVGDMADSTHREACQNILSCIFGSDCIESRIDQSASYSLTSAENAPTWTLLKNKVLELLDVVQFRSPDTSTKYFQAISSEKYNSLVDDILGNPSTLRNSGIYYYTNRGDRLIDLAALRDNFLQKCNLHIPQLSTLGGEADLNGLKVAIEQLLRWGWKYNKNLEEQAAQLHMLTGWSQIVEVSVSRRISSFENQSDILFQLLDSSLTASGSPDCSLKMALISNQVALTCMARLRNERFLTPGGIISDNATCVDILMPKQLSNGACHSILLKLVMAILRNESSEALRRRQYAILLSYFQYCQHVLTLDVPISILQFVLHDEPYSEDLDLLKINEEQEEMARTNFGILRKESQAILDLVLKDAANGSESDKTMALYVIDALIGIDHGRFFLSQLQSRGFLRSCFISTSNLSFLDGSRSLQSLQRACYIEAEFSLLLKICYKYGKTGTQILFSMGVLEHIASCKVGLFKGSLSRIDQTLQRDVRVDFDKQRLIVVPILRLVFTITSLVDTSEYLEVKNKIVRETIYLIKCHRSLFDQSLQVDVSNADELMMEHINLVVSILGKVWPYEEADDYGFIQGLLGMMRAVFSRDLDSLSFSQSIQDPRKSELLSFRLCFSLSSYLYFLVTRNSLRLQVSDGSSVHQPSLVLLGHFLYTISAALARAGDEKYQLLNKVQDINELPRQEVDEIINMCDKQGRVSSSDNIHKRRHIAMVEMCQIVGNRDQLISILLPLAEVVLNILFLHFQDGLFDSSEDMDERGHDEETFLCENVISSLEQLELLSGDKIGHDLKVFHRLVRSLKEMAIQKLTS